MNTPSICAGSAWLHVPPRADPRFRHYSSGRRDLDGDAYIQARAVLQTVADAFAQAEAKRRHVVRAVVYVVDMADAPLVAPAHAG